MNIAKKYTPQQIEEKWYSYWIENKLFKSEPDDREPYTIVIPPPNVTGVLHMGHMLNNTIQDVLVRRARMQGKNACWVPGTDHASIATEAKVVASLKEKGIDKADLTREEFLEHAWQWKEKHGGIILEQLKKLGASCDWDRTCFTMDDIRYKSVIKVFVDLYDKGLIYRGVRMVNWDPEALTALSDEEVIYKEVNSKLYYLKYKVEGTDDEYVTIATTRPETILGDTAVCVNPADERYFNLKGKNVIVPLINRVVPIIEDPYVDMEFGTGCLKITPAHDINDYEIGIKHNLESVDIFNPDGTLNKDAQLYVGKDRFEVRTLIVEDLQKAGSVEKIEDYVNKVGYSERTNAVIEPKLSMQWFLQMQKLAKPALDVVMDDFVRFYPDKFKNTYRHWMENVHDWCISRQLWWGQRIPAYYLPDKQIVVANNIYEALEKAKKINPQITADQLKQDDDVLDTWFSSWLWPMSVFDGILNPDNDDIQYYYPTNDLVTAPEIMFFWVARMIIASIEFKNNIPFKNVYFTGIVRDKLGRKMSKSLGNSPEPIELIEKYGADGVRVGMLLTSPAGNDLPFDEALCEQGRNFSNKIWNALKLVEGWNVDKTIPQPEYAEQSVKWFSNQLDLAISQIDNSFNDFRLSEALMTVYKLIWDDFCSWYLEIIKPEYGKPIDAKTYNSTVDFFVGLMKVLHPFMPFITEEINSILDNEKADYKSIMISEMPVAQDYSDSVINDFAATKEIINSIRNVRHKYNIPNKDKIEIFYKNIGDNSINELPFSDVVVKLGNLSKLSVSEKISEGISFIVGSFEFFVVIEQSINVEEELEKLNQELKYQEGFKNSVLKKLNNKKFVENAKPEIVDLERKKLSDSETKIEAILKQISNLKK
ncbi:MAG: valine--tRNA ligase [Lentimicrobiaceae bacterium]|nr:valine--tRNA ligase [Lentimicrobiaceae bacterium]